MPRRMQTSNPASIPSATLWLMSRLVARRTDRRRSIKRSRPTLRSTRPIVFPHGSDERSVSAIHLLRHLSCAFAANNYLIIIQSLHDPPGSLRRQIYIIPRRLCTYVRTGTSSNAVISTIVKTSIMAFFADSIANQPYD